MTRQTSIASQELGQPDRMIHTVPKSLSSLDEARKMEPQKPKGGADVGVGAILEKG